MSELRPVPRPILRVCRSPIPSTTSDSPTTTTPAIAGPWSCCTAGPATARTSGPWCPCSKALPGRWFPTCGVRGTTDPGPGAGSHGLRGDGQAARGDRRSLEARGRPGRPRPATTSARAPPGPRPPPGPTSCGARDLAPRARCGRRVLDLVRAARVLVPALPPVPAGRVPARRLPRGRPRLPRALLDALVRPDYAPEPAQLDRLADAYARPGVFIRPRSTGTARDPAAVAMALSEKPPNRPTGSRRRRPSSGPSTIRCSRARGRTGSTTGSPPPTCVCVDGVGHFVPLEAPEAFATAVLERVSAGRG